MLKVYAERTHYEDRDRKSLNDILKAHWNDATLKERRATYGTFVDCFTVVERPEEADVHLLTMKWQHYVNQGIVTKAIEAVEIARRARRPIAVFSGGDFEANFPVAGRDIHLFQASAYASRTQQSQHGMPTFFEDPLAGAPVEVRSKRERAVVGFCGQAGASLHRHAARFVRNRYQRVKWRLGYERWEPPPLEHTWFRKRVLKTFLESSIVRSNFVLRTKYRAGVHTANRNDPLENARREFLDNVAGSDYTVCVRGGGNFSVRFYEALAMGRVPIFIDTDCVLPYSSVIDWRRLTVWIDESELADADRLVARFHETLNDEEFRTRQLEARTVWSERLTVNGFYRHFHEHFDELRDRHP